MRFFSEIEALAAERKGGADALEHLLSVPQPDRKIKKIPDDRWLSAMTKCVFQAGFNWRVIEQNGIGSRRSSKDLTLINGR